MASFNGIGNENGKQRVEFKIEANLGIIAHNPKTNWNKEVNIVKWNDGISKLDIREWDPKHERMSKGVTFNESEAGKLTKILSKCFPGDCYRRDDNTQDIMRSQDAPFEENINLNNYEEDHENLSDNLPANELPEVDIPNDDEQNRNRETVISEEIGHDREIAS